jgi:hypothetical protein
MELPISTVAFSFSITLREGDCPPIDLRERRVDGTVASPSDDILEGVFSATFCNSCPPTWRSQERVLLESRDYHVVTGATFDGGGDHGRVYFV